MYVVKSWVYPWLSSNQFLFALYHLNSLLFCFTQAQQIWIQDQGLDPPISYLSNFYCLTWKIPWRPLSNGKSVWLRQTIMRWTDNWMTSSILSSFLLKVNIASLLSFKYFVSVSISSRSEIRTVGSLILVLLAIVFLVSFAFSPEIVWPQFLSVNELSW